MLASIALSREGRVEAERTWRCERNHTVELLPAIDKLLADAGVAKSDLTAVFVSLGPGMYTGLRVGISVAQGLARALSIPALGVGRLELDAYPHAAHPGPIVAVHRAGRGELAWATYQANPWRELTPPRLSKPEDARGSGPRGRPHHRRNRRDARHSPSRPGYPSQSPPLKAALAASPCSPTGASQPAKPPSPHSCAPSTSAHRPSAPSSRRQRRHPSYFVPRTSTRLRPWLPPPPPMLE